jgi:hypothetical protein
MFYWQSSLGFSSITDGSSNTVALAEMALSQDTNTIWGNVQKSVGGLTTPANCVSKANSRQYTSAPLANQSDWRGWSWMSAQVGVAFFQTILPPNSPSCGSTGWEDDIGIYSAASRHVGGAHALLCDGAVRFISENISSGNASTTELASGKGGGPVQGPSPYGIWGALGSRAGGEVVSDF